MPKQKQTEVIGECMAIVKGIKTTIDGGFNISLDFLPEDEQVITKLMRRFANNEKLLSIGLVGVSDD